MASRSRFLVDIPLTGPGEYELSRQESHHAVNVMRHKAGEAVIIFDGLGNYAEAVVTVTDKNGLKVKVDEVRVETHMPLTLTIATAIPKGKRWQTLVEKCTELGVDRIIPTLSERSVVKGEGDPGKWRRWVVEAAKQSRRARIPEILQPTPLFDAIALARDERALLFIADPDGATPQSFRETLRNADKVMVLVGPEGGFSETEMAECEKLGVKGICLSPFTLRIETAAAIVCAIIRELLL